MNSQRMSEIEDGAKPSRGEMVHASIFTVIVFVMLAALCIIGIYGIAKHFLGGA